MKPITKMSVDHTLTRISIALIVAICLPIVIFPDSGEVLSSVYAYISKNFGPVYLLGGLAALLSLIWLAFSRFGNIRLGDKKPEFSEFSWAAMVFAAGIGTGVLYWGAVEWAYHIQSPPFGMEPWSDLATEYAATYGIFHWGFIGWAFFGVATLPVAYTYYVKKQHIYRISEACRGVLGDLVDGPVGRIIDVMFILGLLGAAGTSLGLGTPLIAATASTVFGVESGLTLSVIVLLVTTLVFSYSVYSGLEKGIKWLSDVSIIAATIFLAFVFIVGPTTFIFNMSTTSIGIYIQDFFRMSTWTDAVGGGTFSQDWTMFYWGWWLVLAPFMGIFVTRISNGRTIRQLILGMLGYGTVGCAIFYMVVGNYALNLELTGTFSVTGAITELGSAQAVVEVIKTLPGGHFSVAIYGLITLVFLATIFDSGSYTLAAVTMKGLEKEQSPPRQQRLLWAFTLAILPVTLMFIGGLKSLQTAALVGALPLIFVLAIMMVSFVKTIYEDEKKGLLKRGVVVEPLTDSPQPQPKSESVSKDSEIGNFSVEGATASG